MLGIVGSHRTGKTTLAEAYAEKSGATLVKMGVSELQREIGYDSSVQSYDFETRMEIQEYLLRRFSDIYQSIQGLNAVCDRTPLDLIGYAMLSLPSTLSDDEGERLAKYVRDCINLTNECCSTLILLQPDVPLTACATSARPCVAIMEKLNLIYIGLANDDRIIIPSFCIPRGMTKIEKRLAACTLAVRKSMECKKQVCNTVHGVEISTLTRQ